MPRESVVPGPEKKEWSGSVGRILSTWKGVTVIHLGRPLPAGSSHPPARSGGRPVQPGCVACLHDVAPDGVWHATPVTSRAVGSYPTFSPLPGKLGCRAVCFLCHCPSLWGKVGRRPTLSLWRLAVSQHPARRSPDLPPGCPGDRPTRSGRECNTRCPSPAASGAFHQRHGTAAFRHGRPSAPGRRRQPAVCGQPFIHSASTGKD